MLSIDDYYMAEVTEERTDERGIKRKVAVMKYQHDVEMEEVMPPPPLLLLGLLLPAA